MKQWMATLALGLALTVFGSEADRLGAADRPGPRAATGAQTEEAEQAVRKALQAQHFAYWGKDVAGFAQVAADKFYRIGQDGAITSKDQHLAAMQADTNLPKAPSFHDDVRIRIYGGAAVVTLRDHWPGTTIAATRSTYVFVNRDGGWKMVALHQTRVAQ